MESERIREQDVGEETRNHGRNARDRPRAPRPRRQGEQGFGCGGALKKVYDSKEYKDFMASRGFGVVWADAEGTAKFMAKADTDLGATLKAVGLAK